MQLEQNESQTPINLDFYGGWAGALFPFLIFVSGVIWIALSGAPDERGFWPVLILALGIGLLLAKDRKTYSQAVIKGMSQEIVMIMITAWILASIIGILMTQTGFVEALTWISAKLNLGGPGFVIASFLICCVVSLSTGSSFATILICSPILYPAGGLTGAHLATLAGAIIGGATFGDFTAPISDTTIASALSQKAEIGPTVRSRLKYVLPIFGLALIVYYWSAQVGGSTNTSETSGLSGDPRGLPMLLVPALIIYLFLKGKHLLHGLMFGLLFGTVLALGLGLIPLSAVISLDLDNFTAKSFVIDGINRSVGISFFTILLLGLVGALKASGLIDRLVSYASNSSQSPKHAEFWLAGITSAAVFLTTHSIVAILMVADFANRTGEKQSLSPIRRANVLSLVVCVFPFLLPYFIPVILMANTTKSGADFGLATVAPLEVGLHNFVAWGLLLMLLITLFLGYGRQKDSVANT
ncbi:MAG: Na+/H+ antiporter NhaC family protein [Bacteroidota bacterium]